MRPPYCMTCNPSKNNKTIEENKTQLYWNSDFSTEDFGYEVDGIVGVYSCSDENCGAVYEIADFFLENDNDIRVIKYFKDTETQIKEDMISNCIYCANALEVKHILPTDESYGPYFENEGITTTLECTHCKQVYDVVDLYPIDELYLDNSLEIRDYRTIFLK